MKNVVLIVLATLLCCPSLVHTGPHGPIPEKLVSLLAKAVTENYTDLDHLQKKAFKGNKDAALLLLLQYAYRYTQLAQTADAHFQEPYFIYWYCFVQRVKDGVTPDNEDVQDDADLVSEKNKVELLLLAHDVLAAHGIDTTLHVITPCSRTAHRICIAPHSSSAPAII
jgi:hypothetical protein